MSDKYETLKAKSLPPRGAWIEIPATAATAPCSWSLPPRGAWIEIPEDFDLAVTCAVAPPTGSVD